jgi:hypothetical protein
MIFLLTLVLHFLVLQCPVTPCTLALASIQQLSGQELHLRLPILGPEFQPRAFQIDYLQC